MASKLFLDDFFHEASPRTGACNVKFGCQFSRAYVTKTIGLLRADNPVAVAKKVLQACIYKSVLTGIFLKFIMLMLDNLST